jgi:hypothetical protein
METLIVFIIATLLSSHVGIAWSGVLLAKGNLLDWLPKHIEKIRPKKLQNLFECPKCISGEFALWTYVAIGIHYDIVYEYNWFLVIAFGIAWVFWIIAMTAWFYKIYKYE